MHVGTTAAVAVCCVLSSTAGAQSASIVDVNATGISSTLVAGTDGFFDEQFFTGGFTADGASASGGTDSGIVTSFVEAGSETALTATVGLSRGAVTRIDFEISARAFVNIIDPDLVAEASTSASIGGTDTLIEIAILDDTDYTFTTDLVIPGATGGEVSLSLLDRPNEGRALAGESILVNFGFGISASTVSGRLFNEAVLRGTLILPGAASSMCVAAAGLWAGRRRRGGRS